MISKLGVLEKHLRDLVGYRGSDGTVIRGYEFAAGDGQGRADLLAFADPRCWDISTACIAVQEWPNGHSRQVALRQLSYVGAPIALFARPDLVEVWPVRTDSDQAECPKNEVPYQDLGTYFGSVQTEQMICSLHWTLLRVLR